MKRVITVVCIIALAMVSVGCGGGKTAATSNIVLEATVPVAAAVETTATVGDLKVTVPAGTFATDTTITVSRGTTSTLPPNCGFNPCSNPAIRIRTEATPQGPISLTPTNVPRTTKSNAKVAYRLLKLVDGAWKVVSIGQDKTQAMVIEAEKLALTTLDIIVGYFFVDAPDTSTGLVTLATYSGVTANPYTAYVLVHGINDRAEDMQTLADRLNAEAMEDHPSVIFSFAYDWRQHIDTSAQNLAAQLKEIHRQYSNVSVFAHSAGVLVTRSALEQHGADKSVKHAYLINGPNNGANAATIAACIGLLDEYVINNPGSVGAPSLIANCGDEIVEDLTPGCVFLTSLNTVDTKPIKVAYEIYGTTLDCIVPIASTLGDGIDFEQKTLCTVNKYQFTGFHSTLAKDSGGINQLLKTLHDGTFVTCTTTPEPCISIGNTGLYAWEYGINTTCSTNQKVTIKYIQIETYDYYGNYVGLRSINKARKLVDGFTNCSIQFNGPGTHCVPIIEWINPDHIPISEATTEQLGRSHIWHVRYIESDGHEHGWGCLLTLCASGVWPHDPIQRQRNDRAQFFTRELTP